MQDALIFLHNYRCSGNTVNEVCLRKFPDRTFKIGMVSEQEHTYADFVSLEDKDSIDLFMGHFVYGAHRHISRPAKYFTNVRKPLGRMISGYLQWSNFETPIVDWLAAHPETDNGMTRRLAGIGPSPGNASAAYDFTSDQELGENFKVDDEIFERASATLDACVSVLITERFVESLVLLEQTVAFDPLIFIQAMHVNQSLPSPLTAQTAPQSLRDYVAEHSVFDAKLYDLACQKLDQALSPQSDAFWHKVRVRRMLEKMMSAPAQNGFIPTEQVPNLIANGLAQLVKSGLHADVVEVFDLLTRDCNADPGFLAQLRAFIDQLLPAGQKQLLEQLTS